MEGIIFPSVCWLHFASRQHPSFAEQLGLCTAIADIAPYLEPALTLISALTVRSQM